MSYEVRIRAREHCKGCELVQAERCDTHDIVSIDESECIFANHDRHYNQEDFCAQQKDDFPPSNMRATASG